MRTFDRQTQGISSVVWLPKQPGNFVTSSSRVGVLRLWTVSKPAPISFYKVGSAGVNMMAGALHDPDVVLVSTRAGSVLLADVALKKVEFASRPLSLWSI